MRTTLNLNDALMKALRRRAADSGRSMTEIVEDSLRATLVRRAATRRGVTWKWISVKGQAAPAVDVTDRGRLYDRMEGRE